jgi:hypothetical protein
MNCREKFTGNKEEFYFFLKDQIVRLFKDKLKIEGNSVLIPDNEELDYQIKFDSDETYGDFVIKVRWGEKPEAIEDLEEEPKEDEAKPFEF